VHAIPSYHVSQMRNVNTPQLFPPCVRVWITLLKMSRLAAGSGLIIVMVLTFRPRPVLPIEAWGIEGDVILYVRVKRL
jgi:hypothetical protein